MFTPFFWLYKLIFYAKYVNICHQTLFSFQTFLSIYGVSITQHVGQVGIFLKVPEYSFNFLVFALFF